MSDTLTRLQALSDEFTALRRDIHRHPELGYQEFRTSDLVAERLASWGYRVTRGLGGTGIGGHHQDHVPEVGFAAVGVGEDAAIHDLQEDIEDIRVRLLHFVQQ